MTRSVREWLEAAALRLVLQRARHGAFESAATRVCGWARGARRFFPNEWRWTLRNLELVFGPELSEAQRERLATLAFENHFLSYLEGLRVSDIKAELRGAEQLATTTSRGVGTIVASIHLGSWEPGACTLASLGREVAVTYRRADNAGSERQFAAARAEYPVEWIEKRDTFAMARALRRGKLLVLMTDLNTTRGGVEADFLGLPARSPSGLSRLARRLGCAVVPAVAVRRAPGHATIELLPALSPAGASDNDGRFVTALNRGFEPWIVDYAEQYNWLHPRWRHRPDGRVWRPDDPLAEQLAARTRPFVSLSPRVRALLVESDA